MSAPAERLFLHSGERSLLWPPPDTAASAYRQATPSPALRGCVEHIYLGHEFVAPEAAFQERVLPDGGVHLLFNLGDRPAVLGEDGGADAEVLGARCEPSVIRMAGRVEHVGIRLRPGGVAAVLGMPAGEVVGRTVPLHDLWGARAGEALERLAAARTDGARIDVVETMLGDLLSGADPRPNAVAVEAVRRIDVAGGRLRVRELAAGLGVGERRLEQLFHREVGLSPKAVCRLARFRAAVALLQREPARPWSDLALHCGFYDQSHMVNEFRSLAGLAPGAVRAHGFGFFQDGAAAPR